MREFTFKVLIITISIITIISYIKPKDNEIKIKHYIDWGGNYTPIRINIDLP